MVVALALLLPRSVPAANDSEVKNCITSIRHLYKSLDYEHALSQIQLARQMQRGTEDEVTLSLYEGLILYDMGKQDEALTAFRAALLLRPDVALPEQKIAPKVRTRFEDMRRKVKKEIAPTLESTVPSRVAEPSPKALAENQPPAPSKPVGPVKCEPVPPQSADTSMSGQQQWRLAGLKYELCSKDLLHGQTAETLATLSTRMKEATTNYQRILIRKQIDQFEEEAKHPRPAEALNTQATASAKKLQAAESSRVEQEKSPPPARPTRPVKCVPAPAQPTADSSLGTTQQWRLDRLKYALCSTGRLHGQTAETLDALTTQLKDATTNYQRVLVKKQLDQLEPQAGLSPLAGATGP
ncbi:TPR domain protein [Cystobacter fuscus DSM 2262]|uniref:TPR domain protein n=2 Tax=Cystobacter fuscus TaxID=43 RepID=S9PHA2_CYSF2|nr:TPR domain protein [Cystobacter fuscus DSM 2262]